MAGLAVGLHVEHHSGMGDPLGKEKMTGVHRQHRAMVEAGWLDSARRWRRRMAAGGGSSDFLEQEGEVGGERGPSIWMEVHGAVLTMDGGNNGGSGFISGEKRRASVARGGQVVTGAREGGRGVLARLAFTQRGE
jgi:hypothetical protein